jgi:hypothetical protein
VKPSKIDVLTIILLSVVTILFLLRLAYLPIYTSTAIAVLILGILSFWMKRRLGITVPLSVMFLLVCGVLVDGIGNDGVLGLYSQRFRYIQFDEFAHCLISALVMPSAIWFTGALLNRAPGIRMPFYLVCLFSFAMVFMVVGFYEVIELWDDKYMHPTPGMRIHGAYDTANDLQWNLLGMGLGTLLGYFLLRRPESGAEFKP